MKYDLKAIMTKAWAIYRKPHLKVESFGEALHRAWGVAKVADENRKAVEDAIKAHGITEEVHTWFVWTEQGRKVMHDEKAVFQVTLKTPERGDGKTFVASYFTYSQTDLAENVA